MQQLTLSHIFHPLAKDSNTTGTITKSSLVFKFSKWLKTQEEYRLLWLGIALLGGIALVLPITLLAVMFWANNSLTLWAITLAVNVPVLILNLAAQPPKVTLPVLFSSWFIDAVIILYCLALYLVV